VRETLPCKKGKKVNKGRIQVDSLTYSLPAYANLNGALADQESGKHDYTALGCNELSCFRRRTQQAFDDRFAIYPSSLADNGQRKSRTLQFRYNTGRCNGN
jgi:hypothetical protein